MKKELLIGGICLIVGILFGVIGTHITAKLTSQKDKEELTIKESPYTLNEIYSIISNPSDFNERIKSDIHSDAFCYTLFHFYDYFNQNTPFMYAKTYTTKENGLLDEVQEYGYYSYYEYMDKMKHAYEAEQKELETCEGNVKKYNANFPCTFDYRTYLGLLVYNDLLVYLDEEEVLV